MWVGNPSSTHQRHGEVAVYVPQIRYRSETHRQNDEEPNKLNSKIIMNI